MRRIKFITSEMLRSERATLFVFGDNMTERGLGGQAREMRGGHSDQAITGDEQGGFFHRRRSASRGREN
jgi:hypothetical protein